MHLEMEVDARVLPGELEGSDGPVDGSAWGTIALVLLAGAGIGLVAAVRYWPIGFAPEWRLVLIHGFEGALVGGLCDWFAVWKTYSAVETKSVEVAEGIGRWVSDDLLSHHVVREKLQEILREPEAMRSIYAAVDGFVGTEDEFAERLMVLWKRIEPSVIDYVAEYQLSVGELGAAESVLRDDRIVAAVGECLGRALETVGSSAELDQAVAALLREKGALVQLLAAMFVDVGQEVTAIGTRLCLNAVGETNTGDVGPKVAALARRGAAGYIAAWNDLRATERREAAAALVEHLSQHLFRAVAGLVVKERDRLRRLTLLIRHPRATDLIFVLHRLIDERLSAHLGRFVTRALQSQTPRELRARVEAQTSRYLQLIRVNGTALGFLVGAALGAILTTVGQ